ncbi:MAG: YbaB/EbfC family nucleoid-associated protein [Acidobacteria bacterium]|nr:YbaB/EbfC family nucleoid-associated protein [Acidobacteriota bacterium]
MKIPGFDMKKMMEQAQKMQEEMQRSLKEIRVEASSGGGMVSVVMTGTKELLSIKIDAEVASGDLDMLQDLIVAAINECGRKVEEAIKQTAMKNLNLPPGLL